MVVPEQHHALDQRLVGDQHLLDPPVAQLAALLLHRPHDLQRLAVDAGLALRPRPPAAGGATSAGPWSSHAGAGVSGLRPRIAEQTIDGGGVVLRLEGADFGRRRAEARCATADAAPRRSPSPAPPAPAAPATGRRTVPPRLPRNHADRGGGPWRHSYCGGLPGRRRPRTRGRPARRTRRARRRRAGEALGEQLVHAFALVGAQRRLKLRSRAQGFLLLIGAQPRELIDQRRRPSPCRSAAACSSAADLLAQPSGSRAAARDASRHTGRAGRAAPRAGRSSSVEIVRPPPRAGWAAAPGGGGGGGMAPRTPAARSSSGRRSPRGRSSSAAATGRAGAASGAATCQMPSEKSVNSFDVSRRRSPAVTLEP